MVFKCHFEVQKAYPDETDIIQTVIMWKQSAPEKELMGEHNYTERKKSEMHEDLAEEENKRDDCACK